MTTISWTSSPPRPTTCGPERLWPEKAKLSICDPFDRVVAIFRASKIDRLAVAEALRSSIRHMKCTVCEVYSLGRIWRKLHGNPLVGCGRNFGSTTLKTPE